MAASRGSSSVIKDSDSLHLSTPPSESLPYLQAAHSAPPHRPTPSQHTIQVERVLSLSQSGPTWGLEVGSVLPKPVGWKRESHFPRKLCFVLFF